MIQLREWGGGSSPVKTEPLQIVVAVAVAVSQVSPGISLCTILSTG